MADIKVSTGRLKSDADNVKGHVDRINTQMANLSGYLSELSAMWSGTAWEAFQKAYGEDVEALSTMLSNLRKLYGYEDSAREKYETCEKQVSGYMSGL